VGVNDGFGVNVGEGVDVKDGTGVKVDEGVAVSAARVAVGDRLIDGIKYRHASRIGISSNKMRERGLAFINDDNVGDLCYFMRYPVLFLDCGLPKRLLQAPPSP
jgi:hypothetical protein